MAAIIYRAAGFWRVVHGAQILPFGGAHLGTRRGGTRREVGEEGSDDAVRFLTQEAAELVEP